MLPATENLPESPHLTQTLCCVLNVRRESFSFSRYKSEGFIKEVSTNVAFTCLLSHCHRSLVIWFHSAVYFGRYPQPKSYLLQRAQKNVAKILQFAANSFSDMFEDSMEHLFKKIVSLSTLRRKISHKFQCLFLTTFS